MDQTQIAEKLQVIQDGINTEGNLINQIITALGGKGIARSADNNLPFSPTGECVYGDKFIATGEPSKVGPDAECYDYNVPENTNVIILFKWIGDRWAPGVWGMIKSNNKFSRQALGTCVVYDKYDDGTVLRFELDMNPANVFLIPLCLSPKEEG